MQRPDAHAATSAATSLVADISSRSQSVMAPLPALPAKSNNIRARAHAGMLSEKCWWLVAETENGEQRIGVSLENAATSEAKFAGSGALAGSAGSSPHSPISGELLCDLETAWTERLAIIAEAGDVPLGEAQRIAAAQIGEALAARLGLAATNDVEPSDTNRHVFVSGVPSTDGARHAMAA